MLKRPRQRKKHQILKKRVACLVAALAFNPVFAQDEGEPDRWDWLGEETETADDAARGAPQADDSVDMSASSGSDDSADPEIEGEQVEVIPVGQDEQLTAIRPAPAAVMLEEIVVTANKRATAISDVPGSVAAMSGDDLEKEMAQGLSDYIRNIPGVVANDRGADNTQIIIRGIATSTEKLGAQFTQLPVGIYVDDMPFADLYVPLSIPDLNPFDLERVEVLKGPQSVIFGSGALSGAVRYILKRPALDEWEYKLSATMMKSDESKGLSPVYAGAVNVPINDRIAARLVALTREGSGQIDDGLDNPDQDKLDQNTARALLTWLPTDRLKIDAFHFFQQTQTEGITAADNPNEFRREGGSGSYNGESGFSGTNLLAQYDFERFVLTSSTNWINKDTDTFSAGPVGFSSPTGDPDGDGGDNGPGTEDAGDDETFKNYLDSTSQGLFQEIRLSSSEFGDWKPLDELSVQWQVGLAYQRSKQAFVQLTQDSAVAGENLSTIAGLPVVELVVPPGANNASSNYANNRSVATEKALYGELIGTLWDDWELTLGARVFKTALHVDGLIEGYNSIALNGTPQTEFVADFNESGLTPKAALRWTFSDSLQFFALASKGFQFGGIQLNPPAVALQATVPDEFEAYKSSHLWNYEIGVRSSFFDRFMKLDATAFYLDWTDLQITVPKAVLPYAYPGSPNLTVGFTENIGKARSSGIEVALSLGPWKNFRLTSNASWIKAIVTEEFDSTIGTIQAGTRLPSSPEFQSASALSYAKALDGWMLNVSLSHNYIGQSYNDLLYSRDQGGFETYDLALGVSNSGFWGEPAINLSLVNLKDVRGVSAVSGNANTRDVSYFFARPRTALLSLSFRF